MKRVHLIMITLLVLAAAAVAQAPQQTQPAQPKQAPAAQGAAQAAPAPAAPQPKHVLAAKTQEEFKAFGEANSKTDPGAAEAAAKEFAAKYPDSALRAYLYQKVMGLYQEADNADKAIEMGRRVLEFEPDNPVALVSVATVIANRTRDTDLDRDQNLAEAVKDARHALDTIDTDLAIPPNAPPEQVQQARTVLRSLAYSALGQVELKKKNWPDAEQYLRQSANLDKARPDPVTRLQLTYALDQQRKYSDALQVTQDCLQIQPNNVAERCRMFEDRLKKLVEAESGAAKPGAAPTAPSTAPPPAPKPQNPPPPGR